ncbi:hypothetical protein [Streptosporangium vulgare]|uniref:hypothetical protein n=1 Tax=Streptosporangium vulgare TaxID=46190 RepID=UPI0031D30F36
MEIADGVGFRSGFGNVIALRHGGEVTLFDTGNPLRRGPAPRRAAASVDRRAGDLGDLLPRAHRPRPRASARFDAEADTRGTARADGGGARGRSPSASSATC